MAMKRTVDTYAGKPFRWDAQVRYRGYMVPARYTKTAEHFLHPARVTDELLRELNPGLPVPFPREG
jgi:hypothetical protein